MLLSDRSMALQLATVDLGAYILGVTHQRELRASLLQIGLQKPGIEHAGELVDGRRRKKLCEELGIDFDQRDCATLEEACSLLWLEHPARALELAERHGARGVLELARVCGTTSVAIAKQLARKPKPPKKAHRVRAVEGQPYRALKRQSSMVKVLVTMEPELKAYALEAAAVLGHKNVNKLIRDSLWKEVAMLVSNAPQFQPRRVQPANGARDMNRRARRTGS